MNFKSQKGIALVATFTIMGVLSIIIAGFLLVVVAFNRSTGLDIKRQKALWLAESGIEKLIYKVANDTAFKNSPTPFTENFSDGQYTVTASRTDFLYAITSTGNVGGTTRTITQDMEILVGGYPDGQLPEGFSYASYATGNINLQASMNGTISGNISSGGKVDGVENWTINGTISEDIPATFPAVDYAGYEAIADYVITGNHTFNPNQTYNGIYYVKGNVDIDENVIINGGIVCEGNVNMRQADGSSIRSGAGLPALVSEGQINMSNAGGIDIRGKGLIYSNQGLNLQSASNITLETAILVNGIINVSNTNNVHIIFDPTILDYPPPFFDGYDPNYIEVRKQRNWNEI